MIQIDTDVLRQLSNAARNASEELEEVAGLLLQITSHWDWGCQEKVEINEYIEANRSIISRLRQDSAHFTQVVEQVTAEFVQVETGISSLFEGVDSAISKILATPSEMVNIAEAALGTGMNTGSWNGAVSQIPVVDAKVFSQEVEKGAN